MVKLSKAGHHPEYVSYIEQIDDENVLKALEALRLKATGASSKGKLNRSEEVTPTIEVSLLPLDTAGIQSKPSSHETPLTPATVSSSSSNSTPARNRKGKKSGAANGGLDLRARMGKTATTANSKTGTSDFVPKWKLQPLIKRRSVPTWELVTAAEVKFATEATRSIEEPAVKPSLQSKTVQVEGRGNGDEPVLGVANQTTKGEVSRTSQVEGSDSPEEAIAVTFSREPSAGKNDNIASPEGITGSFSTEAQGLDGAANDKLLDEKTSAKEKDMRLIPDFMEVKVSVKKATTDDTANRSALSSFLSKLDCFWMVDPIIEPSTDFEDNFTYCSATDESDASNRDGRAELQHSQDGKITDGEKEAIEFLNEKGLEHLPRIISTISEVNDIIADGRADPTHLQYISNLLCHMEYKLQDYGRYRRRTDREQPDSETDIQDVFTQIDELKKLIFRIVEDFIDDHVVNPWNAEVSSLPSALSDGDLDSLPTAVNTVDANEDTSTLGDDSVAQPDFLEGKDVTICIPTNPSPSDQNYLPSILPSTLTLTSDTSTKRIDNTSIASSKLESGVTKFVSADLFNGNPTLMTVPPLMDSEECAVASQHESVPNQGVPPNMDVASSAAHKARTMNKSYLMKNLSRLLSRSSKKDKSKKEEPEDRNPNATLEASRVVEKNDPLNTGSPPMDQKSHKMKAQPSPPRRFFGSRQEPAGQSVKKNTSTTLQGAIDNNGRPISEIQRVAHVPPRNASFFSPSRSGSHSPTSVLILPELSDGDHELYAIESIVGTATAVR